MKQKLKLTKKFKFFSKLSQKKIKINKKKSKKLMKGGNNTYDVSCLKQNNKIIGHKCSVNKKLIAANLAAKQAANLAAKQAAKLAAQQAANLIAQQAANLAAQQAANLEANNNNLAEENNNNLQKAIQLSLIQSKSLTKPLFKTSIPILDTINTYLKVKEENDKIFAEENKIMNEENEQIFNNSINVIDTGNPIQEINFSDLTNISQITLSGGGAIYKCEYKGHTYVYKSLKKSNRAFELSEVINLLNNNFLKKIYKENSKFLISPLFIVSGDITNFISNNYNKQQYNKSNYDFYGNGYLMGFIDENYTELLKITYPIIVDFKETNYFKIIYNIINLCNYTLLNFNNPGCFEHFGNIMVKNYKTDYPIIKFIDIDDWGKCILNKLNENDVINTIKSNYENQYNEIPFIKEWLLKQKHQRFDKFLNDKIFNNINNVRRYNGIRNGQNICYMISVLQLLYSIREFRNFFKTITKNSIENLKEHFNTIEIPAKQILLALWEFFNLMNNNDKPINIFNDIYQYNSNPILKGSIYGNLLSTLDDDDINNVNRKNPPTAHRDSGDFIRCLFNAIIDYSKTSYDIQDQTLFTYKQNEIKLFNYTKRTEKYCNNELKLTNDVIKYNLDLEVPNTENPDYNSIQKLINLYEMKKEMDEDNTFKYNNGTQECSAIDLKQTKDTIVLTDDTKYLLIILKRFYQSGTTRQKKSNIINYDKLITVNGKQFKLTGIVIQTGSLTGGHYRYQLFHNNDYIIKFDDNTVDDITIEDDIIKKNGYIFLYELVL